MNLDTIRVVHSFPIWLPQTQTWMYTQVKCLPDTVDVHIVCERTENLDQFVVPNIHILSNVSRWQYYVEKVLRRLRIRYKRGFLTSVARKIDAEIVHSHFGHIGWTNLAMAQRVAAKHIVTFYGADVTQFPTEDIRWLIRYKELFEKANLFLCEGPHMAEQLIALGCPKDKVQVHHLGVEVERILFRPRDWQAGETLRILIAAGFREKKGVPYALEALAQLQDILPIEITIIGDAGSQKSSQLEKKRILKVIGQYGLRPKTRLLGFQPYSVLFEEAYKHHVFISPSVTASDGDTEGGAPVSLIEMIATGIPVVSTLHCDIPEVVHYGMKDWLVKERDVRGLVDRLKWLIQNRESWNEFLTAGRMHVAEAFSAVHQGQKLAKLYRAVLGDCNED